MFPIQNRLSYNLRPPREATLSSEVCAAFGFQGVQKLNNGSESKEGG